MTPARIGAPSTKIPRGRADLGPSHELVQEIYIYIIGHSFCHALLKVVDTDANIY